MKKSALIPLLCLPLLLGACAYTGTESESFASSSEEIYFMSWSDEDKAEIAEVLGTDTAVPCFVPVSTKISYSVASATLSETGQKILEIIVHHCTQAVLEAAVELHVEDGWDASLVSTTCYNLDTTLAGVPATGTITLNGTTISADYWLVG